MSGYEDIMRLAKALGVSVPELLAMHRDNDPFYSGTPAHVEMAEWFAELWEEFGYTSGIHLRRIHYRLVHRDPPPERPDGTPYLNTRACWGYLCDAGKYARNLRLVDPEAFQDRRNPEPRVYMSAPEFDQGLGWAAEAVEWQLPSIRRDLVAELDECVEQPYVYPSGFEYHPSLQPYHVEVWVEKSTMEAELLPLCERYAANLITGAGEMSITSVVRVLQRVARLEKPARILYISDYDPKGVGIPVAVARKLEFWRPKYAPESDIKLEPILLTAEQVAEYRLPRVPIKDSDLGKANFEARHGQGAVELDALEGLYPGELARIVDEKIAQFRDVALAQKVWHTRGVAHEVLRSALEEAAGEPLAAREQIRREGIDILVRYQRRLDALCEEMEAELAPLRERLEDARLEAQGALDTLDPELPELPEPETYAEDEGWLFDADRDYFEQLAFYKSHQSREDAA
jgi:hypothetical protein